MRKYTSMIRIICIYLATLHAVIAQESADSFARNAVPFMKQHCYDCHNAKKAKSGIELQDMLTEQDAMKRHDLLGRCLDAVEYEDMPPDDKVDILPTEQERENFLKELAKIKTKISTGDFEKKAGRPVLSRLNRDEYELTIRDLFGVEFDTKQFFPADGSGSSGFNNSGDALFTSPVMLEKYLLASKAIIDKWYADPKLVGSTFKIKRGSSKREAARDLIRRAGRRAFRRPLTEDEIAQLMSLFVKADSKKGATYKNSMRGPFQAMLMHPAFIYKMEAVHPTLKEWRLSDLELATRLSYFLWSSMPDNELMRLAEEGKLSDKKVLIAQTRRMLKDLKAKAFAEHFGGQWLGLDDLWGTAYPNTKKFTSYTNSLQSSLYNESIEFASHVLSNNRPITDFIHADYTFLNEELAVHYSISGVKGKGMRMVKLKNKHRGGIIGQGAMLVVTSMPNRTSPVKRGAWRLDKLLGTPPPPPPPNAGSLPDTDKPHKGLSFRKQLEKHRQQASCAGCHAKIDPLGFGLENFDAIGRWRVTDSGGKALDTKSILPNGKTFHTPYELKRILLDDNALFVRNFAKQMLTYAIGRELEYYDQPLLNELVATLRKQKMSSEALILGIVQSRPFTHRSKEP